MVAVRPEKGEHIERAIKKFLNKCKKARIVEEYRDRQSYVKPSAVRREKARRRVKTLEKLAREKEA